MLGALCAGAMAEPEEEADEWTVMFYFCGSDLELKYIYATENLREVSMQIIQC